ncbi:hypothetical protein CRG98_036434 [Punica granatum]|uniref:Uncharacterized protein n=1 Tax=Punica granatum TaxID=22663 RepID=A0A2I0IIM5_PUNGR|nr:hypothetical protein CRG98_036434 [Punica granatum]
MEILLAGNTYVPTYKYINVSFSVGLAGRELDGGAHGFSMPAESLTASSALSLPLSLHTLTPAAFLRRPSSHHTRSIPPVLPFDRFLAPVLEKFEEDDGPIKNDRTEPHYHSIVNRKK